MSVRLYANENFHMGVVEILRSLGHDVLTTLEAGQANRKIPDDQVVAFAMGQSRAVLTFNRRHFVRLHDELNGEHCGIIVCKMDSDFNALAHRIDAEVSNRSSLDGELVRINKSAK